MNKISDRWAKLILWAGSYISAILFAIVGGYCWLKTDREELKKECKKVLVVTLIFLVFDIIIALISSFTTIFSFNAYKFISIFKAVVSFIKICTYVVFALFACFGININIHKQQDESKTKVIENKVDEEIAEQNKND